MLTSVGVKGAFEGKKFRQLMQHMVHAYCTAFNSNCSLVDFVKCHSLWGHQELA